MRDPDTDAGAEAAAGAPPTPGTTATRETVPASRARRWALVAAAIGVAFGLGFGWQWLAARDAHGELADERARNELLRMETTLAAATIQAQAGGFETARRLASDFYSSLQALQIEELDGRNVREEVAGILDQRDATITLLSRADPRSGEVLAQQYLRFRVATGGPERALPVGGPEPDVPGSRESAEPLPVPPESVRLEAPTGTPEP